MTPKMNQERVKVYFFRCGFAKGVSCDVPASFEVRNEETKKRRKFVYLGITLALTFALFYEHGLVCFSTWLTMNKETKDGLALTSVTFLHNYS